MDTSIMRSKKRSKNCSNEGDQDNDRISSLTDHLLHRILSFLNINSAVQTCLLSKRWVSIWQSLPYLNFDYITLRRERENYDHTEEDDEEESPCSWLFQWFDKCIWHVLARRFPTSLVKVRVMNVMNPSIAESVICYAVQHKVEILEVGCSFDCHHYRYQHGDGDSIRWPQNFYSCESLTSLKLHNCLWNGSLRNSIQLPKHLSLPALKSLHLSGFLITQEFNPSIFSSCPNLETLELVKLWFLNLKTLRINALNLRHLKLSIKRNPRGTLQDRCKFEILAPKLTTLNYKGCAHIIHFKPLLASLDYVHVNMVSHPGEVEEEDFPYLINIFKKFRHTKSMTLSLQKIQVLSEFPALLDENPLSFAG